MSITPPSSPARAGLARAAATRSGYPIATSARVPLYAISNIARSGATRSNDTSGQVFMSIGGVQVGGGGTATPGTPKILYETLTITDTLNETPNTATCTLHFGSPTVGQAVKITVGSINNGRAEFTGTILACRSYYVDTPGNAHFDLSLIDDTPGLNTRKVWGRYVGQTVTAIATSLVTTYAPTYARQIDAAIGALVIDQISFAGRDLTDALTQLMKRAGSHWKCDYGKRVVIGPDGGTPPRVINAVHPSLLSIDVSRDYSQVVTRVLSEGGGGNLLQQMTPGDSIAPLDTAVWYESSGIVTVGDQRLSYASVDLGGGGSLVGPGAAPSAGLVANLASGAGVTSGVHDYAVAFVTASGESLAGPRTTITVGVLDPPAAPIVGAVQAGAGPDPGVHQYAVSFVTSSGETPPGAMASATTGVAAPPAAAPSVGTPTNGGNVDAGLHDYAFTFVTAGGETTPSPISGSVQTSILAPPSGAITASNTATTQQMTYPGVNPGDSVAYAFTYVTASGETTRGPESNAVTAIAGVAPGLTTQIKVGPPPSGIMPAGVTAVRIYRKRNGTYSRTWVIDINTGDVFDNGDGANTSPGAPPATNTTAVATIPLANIVAGPAGTTARRIYRRSGGAGLRLLVSINNNTTTTWIDASPNSSLGAAPPATNTAAAQQVPLTIATGGPLVTARKVWGTAAGASQLKLIATIADNTTTAYLVTTPDASLGANAPTVNTATGNQVSLSSIPLGAAAVTSRKVYRTAAGTTTPLKLALTIADNATTTALDTVPDGSLGANAPGADTSGLQQPSGAVLAGSTSLIVAGVGAFKAAGGWAVIGNGEQVIRYTGISGNTLTGIPAIGIGAITATIAYNSTVTAPGQLRGIPASGAGAILFSIPRGEPINLLVTENDVPAQTALAALLGTDGIQEDYLSDNRLSSAESRARARAWLALRKDVEVSVRCVTRDRNSASGRTLTVNLGNFQLFGVGFTIQSVTENTFTPALQPHFTIAASSVRFSFEDWQRMIREGIA